MARGPYWLSTTKSGQHHVCGRNAVVLFSYPADQEAAATEHVRRLQTGYTASEKRIRDAAPELLEALEAFLAGADAGHISVDVDRSARAAIAKATGAA